MRDDGRPIAVNAPSSAAPRGGDRRRDPDRPPGRRSGPDVVRVPRRRTLGRDREQAGARFPAIVCGRTAAICALRHGEHAGRTIGSYTDSKTKLLPGHAQARRDRPHQEAARQARRLCAPDLGAPQIRQGTSPAQAAAARRRRFAGPEHLRHRRGHAPPRRHGPQDQSSADPEHQELSEQASPGRKRVRQSRVDIGKSDDVMSDERRDLLAPVLHQGGDLPEGGPGSPPVLRRPAPEAGAGQPSTPRSGSCSSATCSTSGSASTASSTPTPALGTTARSRSRTRRDDRATMLIAVDDGTPPVQVLELQDPTRTTRPPRPPARTSSRRG